MNQDNEKETRQYTEEPITISTDGLSRMSVSSNPLGQGRDDRGVVVTDSAGNSKRTSSIMMGYNKQGIKLENGEYVSWDEFEQALTTELGKDGENVTYISRKTGKQVSSIEIVEGVFDDVVSQTSYITHESTDKVNNQTAAAVAIHSGEEEYKKGVAMLGNDGLKLPSGEYISEQEIIVAMQDYVKRTPIIVIPSEDKKTEPEEKHTVIQRIVNRAPWLFPLVTATAILLSGFGREAIIDQQMKSRMTDILDYTASQTQVVETYETYDQMQERIHSNIVTGDDIFVPEGTKYYSSSDYEYGGTRERGIIGITTNRPEGEYNIDYFSIISDGRIVEVETKEGVDLYDTLKEASKITGKSIDELEAKIHIGGPTCGWLDVKDIILQSEYEPQVIESKIVLDEEYTYSDSINDFTGDTITINDGEKDIILNVRDENGNLIEPGTIVVGSDGQSYQFTEFNLEQEEVIDVEEVQTGIKLNWKLENIDKKEQLAIAAIAMAELLISTNRKKKEYVEMTDSQIDGMIQREFDECKKKFRNTSEFTRATETITNKQVTKDNTPQQILREELLKQQITVEQIESISEGGKKR